MTFVPTYLAEIFERRVSEARKAALVDIRAAFALMADPVKGKCFTCGRTTRAERADAAAYGKYAFTCVRCCADAAADIAAADLAERMSDYLRATIRRYLYLRQRRAH